MKKILIVNKSFQTGGIQSSMVNMANALSQYAQVDLFLYHPEGITKERLSENVRILPASWRMQAIAIPVKHILKTKDIRKILFRLWATCWSKAFSNRLPIQIAIHHQEKLPGYDLAIAFHHEMGKKTVLSGFTRVVDHLTDAKVKAAWIHFDSSTLNPDNAYNEPFYQRMDKILCVSKSTAESFRKANPSLAEKVDYCYNFMDHRQILEKSLLPQAIPYPEEKFICFSACRLNPEKALVRGIKAIAPVFREHPDLCWYIAGSGTEESSIRQAIGEAGLEGRIILLGNQSNPYPYMKNANLILNVSYHEAAPMVFLEARVLGKPVFATRTVSAAEFLNDEQDAFLCENSEEGIRARFADVMADRQQMIRAEAVLKQHVFSNQDSLDKIQSLL